MDVRFILGLFCVFHFTNGQTYRATIDMNGYKGTVTFEEQASNLNVAVTITAGSNTSLLTNIAVKALPALFGGIRNATAVCNSLGDTIEQFVVSRTPVTLVGQSFDTIYHRGLVVSSADGSVRVCATILPVDVEETTHRATFIGPVVGQVWIRKRNGVNGVFVYSDLAYSNSSSDATGSTTLSLTSYDGSINEDKFATRCNALRSPSSVARLTVGNSAFTVGKESGVFAMPSTALKNIVGLTDSAGAIVACAHLDAVRSKTVMSDLFWDDVRGTITMTQRSPFDSTSLAVLLTGISKTPSAYHVHKYPVPQRLTDEDPRCSALNVAGHFNPYNVAIANSPPNASGTSDQYEIGDLSGKFGGLNTSTVNQSYIDWNLPLFGVYSVVGRSIVIHNPDGTRWVCASINHPGPVITATVSMKGPAYGFFFFRQEANKPRSDVSIFGDLANFHGNTTLDHNFHVHQSPIGVSCGSAGGHYDPARLASSPNYETACSPSNPFQCELGDLSRRHTGIVIAPHPGADGKFFFTDTNMALSGPHSAIGRSIVVHVANHGAARYACNNITRVHPTVVRNSNSSWKGDNADGSVRGYITISQETEFDRAKVSASIVDLESEAKSYHIHVLPVPSGVEGVAQCSAASVSGHYNPFDVETLPAPRSRTYNFYEVGDLSGKFGLVNASNTIFLEPTPDNNLPLTVGIVSSAGRSIVIHKDNPAGTRWKCNTIDLQKGDDTGHVVEAQVQFTSDISGNITLRQVVYDDGFASPTTILVSLSNKNSTPTPNHNWHIHIDPVLNQTECNKAKGHFNPYGALSLESIYAVSCIKFNPLSCEVGDLSQKQGRYTIDGSRKLFVDIDVPLHTSQTVLGRSIVFHAENGGAKRLVCANILPMAPTSNGYTIAFLKSAAYDYYRFTDAVAKTLVISRQRVIVLHNVVLPVLAEVTNCAYVMITLAGDVDSSSIDTLLEGQAEALGDYRSTSSCSSLRGLKYIGRTSAAASLKVTWLSVLVAAMALTLQKLIA